MIKEYNIDVPMTLGAIKLNKYIEWIKLLTKYTEDKREDNDYLKVKMLQIFCNLSVEDTYKIPLNNFDYILDHISNLFAEANELKRTFSLVDNKGTEIEFGFIPELDKMTFGEYVDLDKYINDFKLYPKAMAVLFRPKTNIIGGHYKIEDYEGSAKFSKYMEEMPVDVALGAISFISRLQNQLVNHTTHSSQVQVMKTLEQAYRITSEENTDGFKAFTLWLKKMQLKSMMQ
tara:strand:+ start:135 stop:827 length:693 start_codon:yes stop_codon:yes gene_type:complete